MSVKLKLPSINYIDFKLKLKNVRKFSLGKIIELEGRKNMLENLDHNQNLTFSDGKNLRIS
jgi:hypothetical protein